MDRRGVLKLLGACGLAAAALPVFGERRASAASTSRPRFYLQIIPQGGLDAIYTTDPKKLAEVNPGIDIPFAPGDIVETSATRLGPCFRALARWMPRLAIVNGILQNSANHVSGLAHITRYKSVTSDDTPTLLDLLGARRGDEATGAVSIGCALASGYSPGFLGQPSKLFFGREPGLFDHLDEADPEDLAIAARALRRDAERLERPRASAAERTTARNLRASAELFARAAVAPRFAPEPFKHPLEDYYQNDRDLQRALWLFEHGLTRCVTVCVGNLDFDTHFWNTTEHPPAAEYLAAILDHLFSLLDARTLGGRTLAEQTVVLVGSEIGRFPRLNESHGKDHFPQIPHLFFGPGFTAGTFGSTDRDMAALPVSLATGRADSGGHVMRVDDVGTTILAMDGANPETLGYAGEYLSFLAA